MSRGVVIGGLGVAGSRVILSTGREARPMVVGSPTHAATMRAIVDTGEVQPDACVSLIAAARDHDTRRLDAVAGCEFLDDRIRLLE
jgi:hypothetical protein